MERSVGVMRVAVVFIAVAMVAAFWLGSAGPTALQAEEPSSPRPIPGGEAVVPSVELPFDGLGTVWIGPDGLVMIETGHDEITAFKLNTIGLSLVEEDAVVRFTREQVSSGLIHRFAPMTESDAARQSVIFDIPGYTKIDYDQDTGLLQLRVEGAKQQFDATFDFSAALDTEKVQSGGAAVSSTSEENTRCECEYAGPPGGDCRASTTCPPGYYCRCRCDDRGCTCSHCARVRYSEVVLADEQQ
ncbi:MAG: hypothetical protein L6Q92_11765 [Phycisphaerae bacterium]|nr:hypothetical protein [Phycisphaerae bacterium]